MTMRLRLITSTELASPETATSTPQPECIRNPRAARFMLEVPLGAVKFTVRGKQRVGYQSPHEGKTLRYDRACIKSCRLPGQLITRCAPRTSPTLQFRLLPEQPNAGLHATK